MKKIISSLLFTCLGVGLFAGDGGLKPTKVASSAEGKSFMVMNKAFSKPDKLMKDLPNVITEFTVTLEQDALIYARTGGAKAGPDDAVLSLKFRYANLDKAAFQKATNELHDYLQNKLKEVGLNPGNFSDFSSHPKFADISVKYPKGEHLESFMPGQDVNKKSISFTAYDLPAMHPNSMKPASIMADKKLNMVKFNLKLSLMEWWANTSSTSKSNNVGIEFKPQLFGNTSLVISSPNFGGVTLSTDFSDNHKALGYTFGREYSISVDKNSGDVQIDNDKFIEAYKELAKSYIDNMIEAWQNPVKK